MRMRLEDVEKRTLVIALGRDWFNAHVLQNGLAFADFYFVENDELNEFHNLPYIDLTDSEKTGSKFLEWCVQLEEQGCTEIKLQEAV